MAPAVPADGPLLGFRVGGEAFALPAAQVREVVRRPRLTRVPHAPDSLLGLGNLRGVVLPLVALGALIDRPVTDTGRVIVLEQEDALGLLVDEVTGLGQDGLLLDIDALLGARFRREGGGTLAKASGAVGSPEQAAAQGNDLMLLSFAVGGQDYALPVTQVEAVTRLPEGITRLPQVDPVVVGTVERDGALLPLLSLRHLLGMPDRGAEGRPSVVIARLGEHSVGLVVDRVRSVLRVAEAQIDAVPEVLTRGKAEARIQAICRIDGEGHLVSVLGAAHLLSEDLTRRLMQGDQNREQAVERQEEDSEQVLVFTLGGQDFALPVGVVDEVTAMPAKLTPLPRAPDFVAGVMNLRGDVVAVIDQRRRFHGEPASGARRRVIVVTLGALRVGFVVEAVSEVLRVPASAMRAAPGLGDERTRVFDRVASLHETGGEDARMILMVDPRELLDRAERDLLLALSGDAARS